MPRLLEPGRAMMDETFAQHDGREEKSEREKFDRGYASRLLSMMRWQKKNSCPFLLMFDVVCLSVWLIWMGTCRRLST